MSEDDNLILKILAGLREELREKHGQTNARIDETNARLDETNTRLDETNKRVERVRVEVLGVVQDRFHEVELRAATRHTELVASSRDLHKLVEDRFDLRDRVARIETDVDELKRKVG